MDEREKAQGPWALAIARAFQAIEAEADGEPGCAALYRSMGRAIIRNELDREGGCERPRGGDVAARGRTCQGGRQGEGDGK